MKLNKYHLRRFIASLITAPIVVGLCWLAWFTLVLLGAGGNQEMFTNVIIPVTVVWIVATTFWTEFVEFVEQVSEAKH